jgi:hypothetical protein
MPHLCKVSLEDYEQDKPQIIMGTRAGLTKEFNISAKLRLKDPLILSVNGLPVSKRVSAWIKDEPLKIWKLVYGKTPQGYKSLSLASDALTLLKSEVKKVYPQLLEHAEARRSAHLNRRSRSLKKIEPGVF